MKLRPSVKITLLLPLFMIGTASLAYAAENDKTVMAVANPADMHVVRFTRGAELRGLKLVETKGGTGSVVHELLDSTGTKPATPPEGMTFSPDGTLRGKLAVSTEKSSTYRYVIGVRDQGGGYGRVPIQLSVSPSLEANADPIRLTAGGDIKIPLCPARIKGGTGNTKITFVNAQGQPMQLPSGMVVTPEGCIGGKVPATPGVLNGLHALITDEGGGQVAVPIVFTVNPPIVMETTNVTVTANGRLDAPIQIVKASGGSGAIREDLLDMNGKPTTAPAPLVWNSVAGTFEGQVPSTPMQQKYLIEATDQGGGKASRPIILTVNPPLVASATVISNPTLTSAAGPTK